MNFALAKSIFKEIRIMSKQEPKLAQTLKENLKIHLHQYYSNRHLIKNRAKKLQKDDELPKAFLRTLQEANTPNSFTGFKTRVKLIEMYTGISPYIDSQCVLKKGKMPLQMKFLENYPAFTGLKSEKDKQFVRKVIGRVFMGEEKYEYQNLTEYFLAARYESPLQFGQKALALLSPQMNTYVSRILKGQTEGVSLQYLKVYQHMFTSSKKSDYQAVIDSYLKSRYILLDFEDTQIRK